MIKVVVLILTVWDCNTGIKLAEYTPQLSDFSVSGNRIEDCRIYGVERAKKLTERFRGRGFDNVSTNVDCEWQERLGDPA